MSVINPVTVKVDKSHIFVTNFYFRHIAYLYIKLGC